MIMLVVNKCVTTYLAHTRVVVMMALCWMKIDTIVLVCYILYICEQIWENGLIHSFHILRNTHLKKLNTLYFSCGRIYRSSEYNLQNIFH